MRLILSRKGFDSAAGGGPSPILPDGSLLSLPIPEARGSRAYADLQSPYGNFEKVISDLHGGSRTRPGRAHFDPDLYANTCPRPKGWVPAFGQDSAAATHLDNQGVAEGDLFVFFGWFRQTEQVGGRLRFIDSVPDLHVCFGWLRVGTVLRTPVPGLEEHPHFISKRYAANSRVYAAPSRADGGVFRRFERKLQLTSAGSASRSHWELPSCFWPGTRRTPLSYHARSDRWQRSNGHCLLRAVSRGQEFVLQADEYPGALDWAASLGIPNG